MMYEVWDEEDETTTARTVHKIEAEGSNEAALIFVRLFSGRGQKLVYVRQYRNPTIFDVEIDRSPRISIREKG